MRMWSKLPFPKLDSTVGFLTKNQLLTYEEMKQFSILQSYFTSSTVSYASLTLRDGPKSIKVIHDAIEKSLRGSPTVLVVRIKQDMTDWNSELQPKARRRPV